MNEKEIIKVNFQKPWWRIIRQLKTLGLSALILEAISSSFSALIPLMLGWVFDAQRFDYFVVFCIAWAFMRVVEYARGYLVAYFQLRIIYSLQYSAHRFFLETDPIYHARRSSGAILGKITRASQGYEDILAVIANDILPIFISITTVFFALFYEKAWLAFGAITFLIFMVLATIFVLKYVILPNEAKWLEADDEIRAVSAENLNQVHLIRACFASFSVDSKLKERGIIAMLRERKLWLTYVRLHAFNKIIYLGPVLVLGFYIFDGMQKGTITGVSGLALLTTYLRGTREILRIDKPLMKSTKALTRINDLFNYIRGFGRQTFPVLERTGPMPIPQCIETDKITISAEKLYFDYHKDAKIFDHNSMNLSVPCNQENKLYGIIGPSGVGKSTFISILGGQIRPTAGSVLIDGIDIYEVDDRVRKRLIAMQGQVPTSMRGTLKYNLLFGLPEDQQCYLDDHLIDILVRVGLWSLFESKGGLNTFIGESGLNLSGGQRQRLNFASLYLRANYYKPRLILIDEPTSSLDEVSEQAITDMILELAKTAVTMVIAHRIKTVDSAVGLLDFSVIVPEKKLKFYSHNELMERSSYYQKLVNGKISTQD